jgi:hypothetical protein
MDASMYRSTGQLLVSAQKAFEKSGLCLSGKHNDDSAPMVFDSLPAAVPHIELATIMLPASR